MPSLASLLLAALLGQAAVGEPAEFVARLGSGRYTEREAAAEALRTLGRDALPALREARSARDPEVRVRAAALAEQIEAALLVQPTLVQLDFQNVPVSEVVASLSEQSGIQLSLTPEGDPRWTARRITLVESRPVPFWEAMDDLARTAGLQWNSQMQVFGLAGQGSRNPVLNLMMATGESGPSTVSGPFRVAVNKVTHNRERNFNAGAQQMGMVGNANGMMVQPRPLPEARGDGRPGQTSEMFATEVVVTPEPRLSVAQEGMVKVVEAVDDRGQSLAPPEAQNNPIQHFSNFNSFNPMGSMSLQLPIPLLMPETPGRTISRLRLQVPVVVLSRKDEPLIIPLDQKGVEVKGDDISITIHEVSRDPNQGFTTIDLTAKSAIVEAENQPRNIMAGEMMIFRHNPAFAQNQIEIVDAEGRAFSQWHPYQPQPSPEGGGTRMTLRLLATENLGAPVQIRYYSMARTSKVIEVQLDEIPMP